MEMLTRLPVSYILNTFITQLINLDPKKILSVVDHLYGNCSKYLRIEMMPIGLVAKNTVNDLIMDNKEILEKANLAITNGDYEGFLKFCADDTKWDFVGDQILQGKEEVRQYMTKTYLEPPTFRVEKLIAEGEFVVAVGKISMKDKDGKTVDYSYCDIWQFYDGKMADLKAFVI